MLTNSSYVLSEKKKWPCWPPCNTLWHTCWVSQESRRLFFPSDICFILSRLFSPRRPRPPPQYVSHLLTLFWTFWPCRTNFMTRTVGTKYTAESKSRSEKTGARACSRQLIRRSSLLGRRHVCETYALYWTCECAARTWDTAKTRLHRWFPHYHLDAHQEIYSANLYHAY